MNKSKLFALALALVSTSAMVSCDDDDDVPVSKVPVEVRDSFRAMFDGVRNEGWEYVAQYYLADFTYNTFSTEAWYLGDGTWVMTETDYGWQLTYLPVAVQNVFSQSSYSNWMIDDVSLYERPVSSFCVIEVDGPAGNEVSLFYDLDGNLLNTVPGDNYNIMPGTDPSTVII